MSKENLGSKTNNNTHNYLIKDKKYDLAITPQK